MKAIPDLADIATDPPQAAIQQRAAGEWALSGRWTAQGLGKLPQQLDKQSCEPGPVVFDGAALTAMDSAGAWVLQRWLSRQNAAPSWRDWQPRWQELMARVAQQEQAAPPALPVASLLERTGRRTSRRKGCVLG